MRVLFVTSAYPATAGDPRGVFVHRIARSLVRAGVEVTALAPGQERATDAEIEGVRVVRAPYWTRGGQTLASGLGGIMPNLRSRPSEGVKIPPLAASLWWKARALVPHADVVHAHWLYPAGVVAHLAGGGAPLVVTSHGGDFNLARRVPPLRVVSGWVSRRADSAIGVSRELCEQFVSSGVPTDRVFYIPYGVERTETVAPVGLRGDRTLRLIYVGSLIPRKSVRTLIEAHILLRRRGVLVETVVVGDGPEMENLRSMVSHTDGATFEGQKDTTEIERFLGWSDVLVLPSLSEGRPNAVLEAMAVGRAVVATDIPGTRSLVRDGTTGFLFPPGDAAALAELLGRLAAHPDLLSEMGRQGRAAVDEEGLWSDDIAGRHLEVYEAARGGHRR